MKVAFYFRATAFLSIVTHILCVKVDGVDEMMEVRWPDLAAYLVNKYGRDIKIDQYGFGYEVELSENAVLALLYMLHRHTAPSAEELDEVVAKGATKLHVVRKKINAYEEDMTIDDLFRRDAVGKSLNICFRDFPKLVLYNNSGKREIRVEFDAEDVELKFLERALKGELSEDETKMLEGISLLKKGTQAKCMSLLSRGMLNMDNFAKTLHRAASSAKGREVWMPLVGWLEENGYDRIASEIVAKKILL